MSENDNDPKVAKLNVRFRRPLDTDDMRTVLMPYEVRRESECQHGRYVVDEQMAEVECAICHAKLNPIWVLRQFAHWERRMTDLHARYADEMARLGERSKTKCNHCGQMTRISRR